MPHNLCLYFSAHFQVCLILDSYFHQTAHRQVRELQLIVDRQRESPSSDHFYSVPFRLPLLLRSQAAIPSWTTLILAISYWHLSCNIMQQTTNPPQRSGVQHSHHQHEHKSHYVSLVANNRQAPYIARPPAPWHHNSVCTKTCPPPLSNPVRIRVCTTRHPRTSFQRHSPHPHRLGTGVSAPVPYPV